MPCQLPEHAVASLLRQCFEVPRCQAPQLRQHALSRSSTRPMSPPAPRIQHQQKRFSTQNEAADGTAASSRTNLLDVGIAHRGGGSQSLVLSPQQTRGYSQGSQPPERRFAVLGGGITGLSSAHFLTQELPKAKVTIYESEDKLGGWLKSKYVDVKNGRILFEQGPRTLRPSTPASLVTLEMIEKLALEDEVLLTSKNSDAAKNRFIYYPDHLVRMPGPGQDLYSMAWSILTEPVFTGFYRAIWEVARDPRPSNLEDESVASFLNRRLGGPQVGDNIVSAVLHGIYAGDIYQLSAKSIIRKLWDFEGQHGSMMEGTRASWEDTLKTAKQGANSSHGLKAGGSLQDQMRGASVYTFKEGIGQLSSALEASLRINPNVEFKTGDKVTSINYDIKSDSISIKTALNQTPKNYTQAISTISGKTLSTLTPSVPSLSSMHAVTVMVVNLYYSNPNILPERGFGYLIPRSIPFEQNPECALGVVFDSDAVQGQDTVPGTKVTVMLGGHWWDGFSSYPDAEEGAAMAKTVLHRHLKIDVEPDAVNVGLQKDCIPQYVVGHESKMRAANRELMSAFKGKLKVAGNSYTGVGLNDCVMAARDVVMEIKRGGGGGTGLESFMA
ncbi:Protoporphyrinogen oxidase [Stipitochalara longipes BDJ]|nr:Protoporphyrinogen oxidase [Stipitochalara longipes BDJ]